MIKPPKENRPKFIFRPTKQPEGQPAVKQKSTNRRSREENAAKKQRSAKSSEETVVQGVGLNDKLPPPQEPIPPQQPARPNTRAPSSPEVESDDKANEKQDATLRSPEEYPEYIREVIRANMYSGNKHPIDHLAQILLDAFCNEYFKQAHDGLRKHTKDLFE
ncbi:unnamed protein product [Calypogeia fissa]